MLISSVFERKSFSVLEAASGALSKIDIQSNYPHTLNGLVGSSISGNFTGLNLVISISFSYSTDF